MSFWPPCPISIIIRTRPDTRPPVPRQMTERVFDNRTSLVVDPPDGKIPPMTPEGRRRQAAANKAAGRPRRVRKTSAIQTAALRLACRGSAVISARASIVTTRSCKLPITWCFSWRRSTKPASFPSTGGRTFRRTSVSGPAIRADTGRGKPWLSTPPTSHPEVTLWDRPKICIWWNASRASLPTTLKYDITVDDPTIWTKPWTASLRLTQTQDAIL